MDFNNLTISNSKIIKLTEKEINQQDENGNTLLHLAIKKQKNEVAISLLRNSNIKLNIFNKFGFTPLMEVIITNNNTVFDKLIKHKKIKETINSINNKNYSALHLAIKFKQTDMAIKLLKNNFIDINTINTDLCTPFMEAIHKENKVVINYIIDNKKNDLLKHLLTNISEPLAILIKNDDWILVNKLISIVPLKILNASQDLYNLRELIKKDQFILAEELFKRMITEKFAVFSNKDAIRLMLFLIIKRRWIFLEGIINKVDFNNFNNDQKYLILDQVIEQKQWKLIELLFNKIDLNSFANDQKVSLLMQVLIESKWDLINLFVEKLSPNSLNFKLEASNCEILHWILYCGQWNLAKKLILKLNSDSLNIKDSKNELPPIIIAIEYEQSDIVELLINKMDSDSLNTTIINNLNPLYLAIYYEMKDIVLKLIDKMPIEALSVVEEKFHNTPLHLAILKGYEDIAISLVKKLPKEKLFLQEKDYQTTPLHLAIWKGMETVVIELLKKLPKESIYVNDHNNNTALDVAVKNEEWVIVDEIVKQLSLDQLVFNILEKIISMSPIDGNEKQIIIKILKTNLEIVVDMIKELNWNLIRIDDDIKNENHLNITVELSEIYFCIQKYESDDFNKIDNSSNNDTTQHHSSFLESTSKKNNYHKRNTIKIKTRTKPNKINNKSKVSPKKSSSKQELNLNKRKVSYDYNSRTVQANIVQISESLKKIQLNEKKVKSTQFKTTTEGQIEGIKVINEVTQTISNLKSCEDWTEQANSLQDLKLNVAINIKNNFYKVNFNFKLRDNFRPTIIVGEHKNKKDKLLVLYGTSQIKNDNNIKLLLQLQLNEGSLITNFYSSNFRWIDKNECNILWATVKTLTLDDKEIIVKYLSNQKLEQLKI